MLPLPYKVTLPEGRKLLRNAKGGVKVYEVCRLVLRCIHKYTDEMTQRLDTVDSDR